MWSSIHLSAHPVWDEAQYVVTATWRDDAEAEPVTLTRSGIAKVHTQDDPTGVIAAIVRELNAYGLEERRSPEGL